MKKIHYALILDESGSMGDLKKAVISCFNEQIDHILKLQDEFRDCKIRITFCTFNDRINLQYLTSDPKSMNRLTSENYNPGSLTALFDAIGTTVAKIRPQIRENEPVYLAIFTDGMENASREYTGPQIKKLLAELTENEWNIKFFCSDIDSRYYEKSLNLDAGSMCNLSINEEGMQYMMGQNINCLRNAMIDKKKVVKKNSEVRLSLFSATEYQLKNS